jgi:hypothetical protein
MPDEKFHESIAGKLKGDAQKKKEFLAVSSYFAFILAKEEREREKRVFDIRTKPHVFRARHTVISDDYLCAR